MCIWSHDTVTVVRYCHLTVLILSKVQLINLCPFYLYRGNDNDKTGRLYPVFVFTLGLPTLQDPRRKAATNVKFG